MEDVEARAVTPERLAHQSSELARYVSKSPRNLMPRSETVCANLGICILSHLLEHSLYTVLHLKHLNFVLYIETPKFTRGSRGREQTARPSGAVIELRHEEAAAHNQNPVRGARQGHRQFFERTSTSHRVRHNRLTSL